MAAVPSENRLHAQINTYYLIRVYEYRDTIEVMQPNGKKKTVNRYYANEIVSAATLRRYIEDEQSRISLFNEVLDTGVDKYTRLIRKRLKIEFCSK